MYCGRGHASSLRLGVRSGEISPEELLGAVTPFLALKIFLNLHTFTARQIKSTQYNPSMSCAEANRFCRPGY